MNRIQALALIFAFGAIQTFAQQVPVKLKYSGTWVPTAINQQPNSITDEEDLAGKGTFGSFTLKQLRTDALAPQSSNNCPSPVNIPVLAGAGVFRFSDGSLLTVRVNSGGLCIDLVNGVAHISESVQVTGGTGRFQGASGTLSMTGTVAPVFFVKDSNFQALMLMVTGEFSGLMYGSGLGDGGGE